MSVDGLLLGVVAATACTGDFPVDLDGSVQKGPFVVGSTIQASRLSAQANPIGEVFHTETRDDLGRFSLSLQAQGLVALEGHGFYFNEVTGALSQGNLTLRAMYDIEHAGEQTVFVNTITHLTFNRVRFLLREGLDLTEAREQAERELQLALAIVPVEDIDFAADVEAVDMNILGGDSDANAYLLAVSAVLAYAAILQDPGAPDASLQELLNQISLDLEETGEIAASREALVAEAVACLDTDAVMANLEVRLAALESSATVPDLDRILVPGGGPHCPEVVLPTDTVTDTVTDIPTDIPTDTDFGGTPEIQSVEILPSSVQSGTEVQCVYDYFHPDGGPDHSFVEWFLDDDEVGTGSPYAVPLGSRGASLTCRVTPFDGLIEGDSDELTVEVVNAPPQIDAIEVAPGEIADASSELECQVTASDADGDTISIAYTWSVDGVPTAHDGPIVPADDTQPGESWACEATPSDEAEAGASETATARIYSLVAGGVLTTEATWTAEGSPYYLDQEVQIASTGSLVLEPGVEVRAGEVPRIRVAGTLDIAGAPEARVRLEGVAIVPAGTTSDHFTMTIRHAHLVGGTLWSPTGNGVYGSFVLEDSIIEDLESYLYLSYPQSPCIIARNLFLRSGGISAGLRGFVAEVRNNVFVDQQGGYGEYAVQNWSTLGGGELLVHHNSFLSTDRTALRLRPGYSSASMDGRFNYWGGVTDEEVPSLIFDANDDIQAAGTIPYLPTLDAPHPDTPDPTPWLD